MDVTYSEEQEALRAAVRDLLADHSPLERVRAVGELEGGSDLELYRQLAAMGATDLPGPVESGIVFEECGRALAATPLLEAAGWAAPALAAADPQHWLLDAVRGGEAVPVLATDGDVAVDSGYAMGVLHRVPRANAADHLVFAIADTLHAVATEECRVDTLPTMDATRPLCTVLLEDAPVDLVGNTGDAPAALTHAATAAAVAFAHELLGIAQACLERAVAHAGAREQFGKPIGTYQAVSHRCADMFVEVERARSLTVYAAWAVQEGVAGAGLAASQAKAAAGDAAVAAAQSAIQVHGGIGFTWEHDLHLYLKRARSSEVLAGSSAWHRQRIGEAMVTAG